jgi:hypothetical protein
VARGKRQSGNALLEKYQRRNRLVEDSMWPRMPLSAEIIAR